LVTNGDGQQVFRSKTGEGPSLTGIDAFVPQAGRSYLMRATMRKIAASSGITSWLRPGFIVYPDAPTDYSTNIIIKGPTSGPGLIAPDDFIDTSSWVVNEWYEILCLWVCPQNYPAARPRIRLNRSGAPDGIPFSDAIYEILKFEVLPKISLGDIRTEFVGPTPTKLTDYYRKTVLSEITNNVVDTQWEFDSMYLSEAGNHPSVHTSQLYLSSDYGTMVPRGNLPGGGQVTYVTDPTKGPVIQTQGQYWGSIIQARSYGELAYFKLESGATYNMSMDRRQVTDPTTTNGNPCHHIMGLYCFDVNYKQIGGIEFIHQALTAADGWQTLTGSKTYAQIVAALPGAVYAKWYTYDNIFAYVDPVTGNSTYYTGDQINQTTNIGVTKAAGGTLPGVGFTKIYDNRNNSVYNRSGTVWTLSPTEHVDDLGIRTCTNPYTHKVFGLGNFYVVDRPYTSRIPTSGEIRLSDFLGTKRAAGPIWYNNSAVIQANCGDPITITCNTGSDDGLTITYRSVDLGFNNWTLNGNTGVITGTVPFVDVATTFYGFTIAATDGFLITPHNFTVQITNRAPNWNTAASLPGASAGAYSLQFSATDPEGQGVKYMLASGTLPSGTTLSATGLLSGTVSAGTYTFELAANDNYTSNFRTFTLVVT
jgi:hypothetical protein